ncbi:MAG TPA: TonB-dependent receptor [Gemmatimonadales bacterium]|nr:TonB-dependent receptor [Gemmatimonadales bacterium]
MLLLLTNAPAVAQEPGRIVGRVVDAAQGAPISGAQVELLGSDAVVVSALDGRFSLTGVPEGPAAVRVRMIGYTAKLVSGIAVRAGEAAAQDISLEPATVEVAEIAVTSEAERGSVSRALDEQRNAVGVVNAVSREQIQRSPDSDAGQAVQRVSGVTVQDGKYVFVRGLGERYTTTSLNGARVPSPEPERKVVPLDMFPSSLIETITTSKTYTPDQSGDFSGAQVDIKTREFPGQRQIALSVTSGFNTEATRGSVPAAPTSGGEWLALASDERQVPLPVANAGDLQEALPQAAINQMVSSFRPAWSPRARSVMPNMSFGLSTGGTQALFSRSIGYLVSGTYAISQEVQTDQVRGVAIAGSEPGSTVQADQYAGTTGRTGVLWGGLVNLSTSLGDRTRISLNNAYNRTADNDARHEVGMSENLGLNLAIDRLRYVERAIRSTQLAAVHQIGEQTRLDWSATSSGVTRREPDRSEIVYARDEGEGGAWRWLSGSNEGAVRTFGDLAESSLEASANLTLGLGPTASSPALKLGALARHTSRDAETAAYSISAPGLAAADRALTPEEIFDGRFSKPDDAVFRISPLSQGGAYEATDRLFAGYAMGDLGLASNVRLVAGARLEASDVTVTAEPTIGTPVTTSPSYLDVLPSAAINYNVTGQQTLRFSLSQTLSRPEYRELAEVQYREVLGGDNVVGNPGLRRTLIRNADLRWEWYPAQGEIVSVGLFAKQFDSPIERIYLATSGTRLIRYVNAEGARNYGVELDLRKNLGFLAPALAGLSAFANATVMHSDVEIGASDASRTSDNRAMVGQAPYVVNGGLTFSAGSNASATALVNRVGRRIVSASEAPLPDIYEEARTVMDVSLRFPVAHGITGRIDAKNLLDAAHEVTQGTVVREAHHTGRVFQVGFNWTL